LLSYNLILSANTQIGFADYFFNIFQGLIAKTVPHLNLSLTLFITLINIEIQFCLAFRFGKLGGFICLLANTTV